MIFTPTTHFILKIIVSGWAFHTIRPIFRTSYYRIRLLFLNKKLTLQANQETSEQQGTNHIECKRTRQDKT
jgi:hypothetical protein